MPCSRPSASRRWWHVRGPRCRSSLIRVADGLHEYTRRCGTQLAPRSESHRHAAPDDRRHIEENAIVNSGRSMHQGLHARGMTRRGLLRGSAALGLGVTVLGGSLAPRVAAAQEGGEPVALTIWLEGEPGTVTAFSEIIDAYMQENPNVAVELAYFGSDLFNPTLIPALNAGEG